MKVYCVQIEIVWEDRAANFERVERMIDHENPFSVSTVIESFEGSASAEAVGLERRRRHALIRHESLLCGVTAKSFVGRDMGPKWQHEFPT